MKKLIALFAALLFSGSVLLCIAGVTAMLVILSKATSHLTRLAARDCRVKSQQLKEESKIQAQIAWCSLKQAAARAWARTKVAAYDCYVWSKAMSVKVGKKLRSLGDSALDSLVQGSMFAIGSAAGRGFAGVFARKFRTAM